MGVHKGTTPWNKGKKVPQLSGDHNPRAMLGRHHTVFARTQIKLAHTGVKNINWKGDGVGYSALHSWVRRKLGKPARCEHCGIDYVPKGKKRYFQWANKSQKYLRDVNDWLRLCIKCHKQYDGTKKGK